MEISVKKEKEIKRMPRKRSAKIKTLSDEERLKIEGLIDAIESTGLNEFMEYIRSPWRMLWPNFIAGIARGFGALIGVAIVITLIGWVLSTMISLPLIGKWIEPYVHTAQDEFKKYTEATNYKENFERIEMTLGDIKTELQKNPR
ncbi:hypothetical protein KBD33_01725 [Candidatus Gracilibacteria bacterium]|nr:hypothetical protein [Candidatus Gracilibacteria bacterium]